jgi:hypothetical protein
MKVDRTRVTIRPTSVIDRAVATVAYRLEPGNVRQSSSSAIWNATYAAQPMAEWIGEILVAPDIEAKLRQKHNLTPDQMREAVSLGAHDRHREASRRPG